MKCPKCGGKTVPYSPDAGSDRHCYICGYYWLPEIAVVMPDVPRTAAQPLSQNPKCVYNRQYRRQLRQGRGPHRKTTAAIYQEVNP